MILTTFESLTGRNFTPRIINPPVIFGSLYSSSVFSDTSYFTPFGTTSCSISSGNVLFGGGSTSNSSGLYLNYGYTLLNKFTANLQVGIGVTSSLNSGFGFGITSFDPNNLLNLFVNYSPISGTISVPYTGNTNIIAGGLSASSNDTIRLTVDNVENVLNVTASNINSGRTISGSFTYGTFFGAQPFMANTGKFSIYTLGNASYTLKNLSLSSNDYKYPTLMLIGDSKTVGYYSATASMCYSRQLQTLYTYVDIRAGGSDRTVEILEVMPEILNFVPTQAILAIGSNDPRYGGSELTFETNYASISTQLINAGTDVYYCLPFPENGEDLTTQKNYIQATYPAGKIIDTWSPLTASVHQLNPSYDSGDGVHPNQAGHTVIATTIENFFNPPPPPVGDPIANAWIAALGANGATQDSTHQTYIQTFIAGIRTDGLLSKIYALYIPIFGSAAANKFNVLNSLDSDAAFRLTFTGGFTYNASGTLTDGSTGFANTHFNPAINATINNIGLGVYSRINGTGALGTIGNYDGTNATAIEVGASTVHTFMNSTAANDFISHPATSTRLIYSQRNNSSTTVDTWRDGSELGPATQNTSIAVSLPFFIWALNQNGSAAFFTALPMSLILITDGSLSGTDVTNLTNRVNTFLTSWGINV